MKTIFCTFFLCILGNVFAQNSTQLQTKPQQFSIAKSPESLGFSSERLAELMP